MSTREWKSYDSIASRYDDDFARRLIPPARDLISAALSTGQVQSLLDFGIGTGVAARAALAALPPGSFVTGVDLSHHMLKCARTAGINRLVLGDGAYLPFASGVFQTVVSNCVLAHFRDVRAPLTEIKRVLASGGVFCMTMWSNEQSPMRATWRRVAERFIPAEQLSAAQAELAPSESLASNSEALTAAMIETSYVRVTVAAKQYESTISIDDYLVERTLAGLGRFIRHRLNGATWEHFIAQAESEMRTHHPDPMTVVDTVLLAVGFKE